MSLTEATDAGAAGVVVRWTGHAPSRLTTLRELYFGLHRDPDTKVGRVMFLLCRRLGDAPGRRFLAAPVVRSRDGYVDRPEIVCGDDLLLLWSQLPPDDQLAAQVFTVGVSSLRWPDTTGFEEVQA